MAIRATLTTALATMGGSKLTQVAEPLCTKLCQLWFLRIVSDCLHVFSFSFVV